MHIITVVVIVLVHLQEKNINGTSKFNDDGFSYIVIT